MELPASARRVQDWLEAAGHPGLVRTFPSSTRSAAEAAAAIGCDVGQIAKSLVFRAGDGRAVLVIAAGSHRVDEGKLSAALGGLPLGRADAAFVREQTGFAIGGVPPVGHATTPLTVIDSSLLTMPLLWAAAGTPNAVFPLTPADLVRLTGGVVADIA